LLESANHVLSTQLRTQCYWKVRSRQRDYSRRSFFTVIFSFPMPPSFRRQASPSVTSLVKCLRIAVLPPPQPRDSPPLFPTPTAPRLLVFSAHLFQYWSSFLQSPLEDSKTHGVKLSLFPNCLRLSFLVFTGSSNCLARRFFTYSLLSLSCRERVTSNLIPLSTCSPWLVQAARVLVGPRLISFFQFDLFPPAATTYSDSVTLVNDLELVAPHAFRADLSAHALAGSPP